MPKRILSILYYICFVAALFLMIYWWYLRSINRNEEAETIQWIALALLLLAVIVGFYLRFSPAVLNMNRQVRTAGGEFTMNSF
jgi:TRAP-type C4-dicarboxylate transport system permease small subunit